MSKSLKKCITKKIKFEDYKNCLEAAQLERKINYLRKKKIDVDSLKEDPKDFVKDNKLISKTQQRFKSKRHNDFTEEINQIALSSNDKRMTSDDSIETYAYGMSKDLICQIEKIKHINIIKPCKNVQL